MRTSESLTLACSWDSFLPVGLPCLVSVWGLLPCFIVFYFVLFRYSLSRPVERKEYIKKGEVDGG